MGDTIITVMSISLENRSQLRSEGFGIRVTLI